MGQIVNQVPAEHRPARPRPVLPVGAGQGPDDRFPTASEFSAKLRALRHDLALAVAPVVPAVPTTASPPNLAPPPLPPHPRPNRHRLWLIAGVPLLAVLGLVSVLVATRDEGQQPDGGQEGVADESAGSDEVAGPEETAGSDELAAPDQVDESPTSTTAEAALVLTAPRSYGGHGQTVTDILALSDGRMASGSLDNSVQIWDPNDVDAEPDVIYQGHTDGVLAMVELADGRIASAGQDNTVHVWDPDDPEGATTFTGHDDDVHAVIELPDGRIAPPAAVGGIVLIWDPDDLGAEHVSYTEHTGSVLTWPRCPTARSPRPVGDGWAPDLGPGTAGGHHRELHRTVRPIRAIEPLTDAASRWRPSRPSWSSGIPTPPTDADVRFTGHTEVVLAVTQLADGRVASVGRLGDLLIWDPANPDAEPLQLLGGQSLGFNALAELADRRLAFAGSSFDVEIWDAAVVSPPGS